MKKRTTAASRLTAMLAATAMLLCSAGLTAHAEPPSAPPDGGGGAPGGGSSAPTSWDADLTYTSSDNNSESTAYSPSVTSSASDTNAILNNGGTIWLKNVTASRTGSSSTGGDDASFYGIGATLLTVDGTTYIDGATIDSTDKGGAGIFAYNTGTTYVRNAAINTTANTAGGIHAAGGGTLYAYNVNATSAGQSSAALRSDRGGGTMIVEGGSYTSNGTRSPAVYCTADITVADSLLTATKSEAVCIEGKNSLSLFNCDLSGDAPSETENSGLTWGIILYQSMSGDSSVGNSEFYMDGGTLKCTANGSSSTLFFNTNTASTITLNHVDIDTAADYDYFLLVSGFSRWGNTGSNGADCIFTAIDQEMVGNIGWDSISEIDFYLTDGSELTGAVVNDNTFGQTESGSGYCTVYIDADSDWICTGNSTVTNLYNAGSDIVDAAGKTVTIVAGGSTVVSGESEYTITVAGSYSTEDKSSGATKASSYTYTPYAEWNPWDGDSETAATTEPTETASTTAPAETTVPAAQDTTEPAATTIESAATSETRETPPPKPGEESTTTATDENGNTVTETRQTPPPKPGEETTTMTATEPVSTETTGAADYSGDVNLDGTVDIMDVIALNKFLLGTNALSKEQQKAADADKSNTVDSNDALLVLKCVVGTITLPVNS